MRVKWIVALALTFASAVAGAQPPKPVDRAMGGSGCYSLFTDLPPLR